MTHPKENHQAGQGVVASNQIINAQMVADQAAAINLFQAAKVRAASLGHELHQVGTGFMMTRWTHSRHFDDLASVVAMLDQMSARKAGGL